MTLCKGGAWIVLQKASPGKLQQAGSPYSGVLSTFFCMPCGLIYGTIGAGVKNVRRGVKKYNCWRIDLSKRLSGDVGRQWHNPYNYTKVE